MSSQIGMAKGKEGEPRKEGTSCWACPWRQADSNDPKVEDMRRQEGTPLWLGLGAQVNDKPDLAFYTGAGIDSFLT